MQPNFPRTWLALLALVTAPAVGEAWIDALPQEPATLVMEPPMPLCVLPAPDGLRGVPCAADDRRRFYESPEARRAAGRAICWHTADAATLREIEGVGEGLAGALAAYRARGGRPLHEDLLSVRGVGGRVAEAVVKAVTTDCAHAWIAADGTVRTVDGAWSAGSATPPPGAAAGDGDAASEP